MIRNHSAACNPRDISKATPHYEAKESIDLSDRHISWQCILGRSLCYACLKRITYINVVAYWKNNETYDGALDF